MYPKRKHVPGCAIAPPPLFIVPAIYTARPKTEKETETYVSDSLVVAVTSMQGWREEMEDAYCVLLPKDSALDRHALAMRRWRDESLTAAAAPPLPEEGCGSGSASAVEGGGCGAPMLSARSAHSQQHRGDCNGGDHRSQSQRSSGSGELLHCGGGGQSPQNHLARQESGASFTASGLLAEANSGLHDDGHGVAATPRTPQSCQVSAAAAMSPYVFSSHGQGSVRQSQASDSNARTGARTRTVSVNFTGTPPMAPCLAAGASASSLTSPLAPIPQYSTPPLAPAAAAGGPSALTPRLLLSPSATMPNPLSHRPPSPALSTVSQQHSLLHHQKQTFVSLFGVFDGHGGPDVSEAVSRGMSRWVTTAPSFAKGDYERALFEAFTNNDATVHSKIMAKFGGEDVEVVGDDGANAVAAPTPAMEDAMGATIAMMGATSAAELIAATEAAGAPYTLPSQRFESWRRGGSTATVVMIVEERSGAVTSSLDAARSGGQLHGSNSIISNTHQHGSGDFHAAATPRSGGGGGLFRTLSLSQQRHSHSDTSANASFAFDTNGGDTIRIICANAGDSRALLVRANGLCAPLSRDHVPSVPSETTRIAKAGGTIEVLEGEHCGRVDGVLAVSRGFGDFDFKANKSLPQSEQRVVVVPEVRTAVVAMGADGSCDVAVPLVLSAGDGNGGDVLNPHGGGPSGAGDFTSTALMGPFSEEEVAAANSMPCDLNDTGDNGPTLTSDSSAAAEALRQLRRTAVWTGDASSLPTAEAHQPPVGTLTAKTAGVDADVDAHCCEADAFMYSPAAGCCAGDATAAPHPFMLPTPTAALSDDDEGAPCKGTANVCSGGAVTRLPSLPPLAPLRQQQQQQQQSGVVHPQISPRAVVLAAPQPNLSFSHPPSSFGGTHIASPASPFPPSRENAPLCVVLACDGIWDCFSSTVVSNFVTAAIDAQIANAIRKLQSRGVLGPFEPLPSCGKGSSPSLTADSNGGGRQQQQQQQRFSAAETKKLAGLLFTSIVPALCPSCITEAMVDECFRQSLRHSAIPPEAAASGAKVECPLTVGTDNMTFMVVLFKEGVAARVMRRYGHRPAAAQHAQHAGAAEAGTN